MNRKSKTIVWISISIFLIIVFASLATYAYFNARLQYYGGFDVEVTSKGVDTLSFTGSEDITIVANANNFSMGIGKDLTGTAEMEVKLETTKNETAYCYELVVDLPDEKVFTYSDGKTPELLLSVRRSSDGSTYQNVISNLDITEKTGVVKIPIESDGSEFLNKISVNKNNVKVDYWQADITLVYLADVNQAVNDLKSYSATLEAKRVECN